MPEGWKQRSSGEVPPGKILSERVLTEYKCMTCANATALLVSVADVPLSTPLSDYVTKNTLTGEKWTLESPPEDFTINNVPAARIKYVQGVEAKPSGKSLRSGEASAFTSSRGFTACM